MSRPSMPHVPDPFPHEDQRSPLGPRCARPEKHAYGCRCIDPSHGFPEQQEADLDALLVSMWAGDQPPEQVDIDAMTAYRQRRRQIMQPVVRRAICRGLVWGLGIAFCITVYVLFVGVVQHGYRPL